MNWDGHVILLVEDNENDAFFMQRALSKANVGSPLDVVIDGQQAIEYLSRTGRFADRREQPLPSLIFLDLKLPFVHGFEVLSWMRSEAALKELPVVVLTSSPEERDRVRAEQLGARAYFVKPPSPEMVREAMAWAKGGKAR